MASNDSDHSETALEIDIKLGPHVFGYGISNKNQVIFLTLNPYRKVQGGKHNSVDGLPTLLNIKPGIGPGSSFLLFSSIVCPWLDFGLPLRHPQVVWCH